MKALTAAEMREVDRLTTDRHGIRSSALMENAGAAVAKVALREISLRFPAPAREVLVLCGKGNNGGDGLVAARYLRDEIPNTVVVLLGVPSELRGDPALNFERWRQAGGETLSVENEAAFKDLLPRLASADVILDAVLGTGLRGGASGLVAAAIHEINSLSRNATAAVPGLIVAADMPSGLPSDGESAGGPVLRAHITVTFTAPKIGQLLARESECCGTLVVCGIGSPASLAEELGKGSLRWSDPQEFARFPLLRPANSHKGLYGHILVVGGSLGKTGAAALAGAGALKAGAGLLTIATPDTLLPIVAAQQAEYMTEALATHPDGSIAVPDLSDAAFKKVISGKTVLAVGPGLGQSSSTQEFIRALVQSTRLPTILDADGLNAFSGRAEALRERNSDYLAVTPHPGEMARLFGISNAEVQKDRLTIATEAAKRWNVHVLLKGFHTILAAPDGQTFVNTTGNPGLAKGGSGDVLTGVLAALTGQFGVEDWIRVLALGAWLHGRAADTLIREADPSGILAGEVARALPYARSELLGEIRHGG